MWWRRGWLLNTLNYHIEKNLKESIYKNDSYLDNKWGLIERQVIRWSSSPGWYAFLLSAAFILSMICVYLWLPDIRMHVSKWDQPWGDLIDWQSVVLATQLTIIGLIFPLVLGFVGLLLQNKTANKALWSIYSRYSGFMFVGFSSLLLSGIIVFGQYIHPWLSHSDDIIFSIGISSWFLFNIALLGWFLYSTFEFISNDNRNSIILRYCMNETLIGEIKSRLAVIIPNNAIQLGLIPANVDNENMPEVNTYYYTSDKDNKFIINYKNKKYLKNIYYRLLSLYVSFWKSTSILFYTDKVKPKLLLPISGKTKSDKNWGLALSSSPLGRFSKSILRLAYSFGKHPDLDISNMKPIINALISNVDDSLKDNNIRLFRLSMGEMEYWHAQLLASAAFINDNGEWDNWLLLSDGSLGDRTLLNELSREYYELSRIAVKNIPESVQYYEIFCNFFLHIYIKKNKVKIASKVINELITNHYHLFTALLSWQNSKGAEQLNNNEKELYDNVLISFVGSWEHWPTWLRIKDEGKNKSLPQIEHHTHHLACSARLLINALRHDDLDATSWAADILNHWYANVFSGRQSYQFGWKHEFLVHTLLRQDKDDPIWLQILNGNELNLIDATELAVRNTWFDIRMISAAYMTNKPIGSLTSEMIDIIMSLIKGNSLKPSGGVGRGHMPIRDGSGILELFIRQSWYWDSSGNSYGSWLDSVIESFGRIEERRFVTGRVHSGWGSSDVRNLRNSYMAFAIMYSQREWGLMPNVMKFLFSDVVELSHRETLIRDLEEWLKPSDSVIDKARLFIGEVNIEEKLINYKNSLSKVIDEIKNKNNDNLVEMPVDSTVLNRIGVSASLSGFTLSDGLVPQRLFNDIEYVDELNESKKRTNKITEFNRNYVIAEADLYGYDEIVDDIVSSDISSTIFRKLIEDLQFTKEITDAPQILLSNILTDIETLKGLNYQPILFVGPQDLHQLIDSLLWSLSDEFNGPPIEVRRDDGYADSYFCHINNIEVYDLPFHSANFSILVAKECFDKIEFRRIGDGCFVEVDFNEFEDKPHTGDLLLSYWLNETFCMIPGYKYIESSNEQ